MKMFETHAAADTVRVMSQAENELGGVQLMRAVDERVTVGIYDHMALLDIAWSAETASRW